MNNLKRNKEVLEDLRISCENHMRSIHRDASKKNDIEWYRFRDRVAALAYFIELAERLERMTVNDILKTMMAVSTFHVHQDCPMPERYWKLIATAIHKSIM